MLAEDGALIVKFWLHLSKKAQQKRLRGPREQRRARAGGCSPLDWKHFKLYDRFRRVSESGRCASTDAAGRPGPWSRRPTTATAS